MEDLWMYFLVVGLVGGVYAFGYIGIGAFDAVLIEIICMLAWGAATEQKKAKALEAEKLQLLENIKALQSEQLGFEQELKDKSERN